MNSPQTFRLRCSFVKQGRLALLSHLEIARALERAVRRSGLPFAISQGFSPHMKIAFGAALPVGVGSTCEIFDLTLTDYVAPEIALQALQQASVPDLMVQECIYIQNNAPAASVAFPLSSYQVVFGEAVGTRAVEDAISALPDSITVVRKKKEKQLVIGDYLSVPFKVEEGIPCRATFTLEAKPTGSLRPDLLCEQLELPVVNITRIAQK